MDEDPFFGSRKVEMQKKRSLLEAKIFLQYELAIPTIESIVFLGMFSFAIMRFSLWNGSGRVDHR